jgi:hypothetical protein
MVVVQVKVLDSKEGARLVERIKQDFAGADAYLDRERMLVWIELKKMPEDARVAFIDFLHEWNAEQRRVALRWREQPPPLLR